MEGGQQYSEGGSNAQAQQLVSEPMGSTQPENQQDIDEVDFKICGELGKCALLPTVGNLNCTEEKNRALDEFIANQSLDGIIQVRIQQLAVCKVLVNIHKRDLFILVRAYTNLG